MPAAWNRSATLLDDPFGEPFDRLAVAVGRLAQAGVLPAADLLHPGPRHAHRAGHAQLLLGSAVELGAWHVVEADDDLERFVRPPVLSEVAAELPYVMRGVVPGIGVADPAVAVLRR